MTSSDLLLDVQEVLVLNLSDYIFELNNKYEKLFKPPPEGIYLVNTTRPILKEGQPYFRISDKNKNNPLESLDKVEEAIVDENGTIIIPAYIMARRDKMLLAKPNLPLRAYEIAKLIVQEWFDDFLMHKPTMPYTNEIMEHVLPEGLYYVENNFIERACSSLINQIAKFAKANNWNIYEIKLRNTDLIVERLIDYRIYQWTLNKEQQTFETAWSD